ncbi:MAG: hypothetical protein ACPGSL_01505 [Vicingaceae bacterium]
MELLAIILLSIVMVVLLILLINTKKIKSNINTDIVNKLNYINFILSKLDSNKELSNKNEDVIVINESLLSIMDELSIKKEK